VTDPLCTGNPLAERRYAYAQAAARDRDFAAAAEVLEQALELDPHWAAAWFALGEARQQLGAFEPARAAFAQSLRFDAEDRQGASLRLAAIDGEAPAALPPAYVARLFDDYAPRFERHLTGELSYRGPQILSDAVEALAPGRHFRRALDLGCGSGLAGVAFRPRVGELAGVDLSTAMVEKARRTGVYDALVVGDVVDFLRSSAPGGADLIVAADVFVYLGDLAPAMAAAAVALSAEGVFAFTAEAEPGEDFGLGETLRFRHSRAYLARTLTASGLRALRLEAASTRREAGSDVAGFLVIAQRRP
jgi:predicted TPR repeat methyltransferase